MQINKFVYVINYVEAFQNQETNISYAVSMYNHPVALRIEFIPNSRDLSEAD
jgi:hypothetical protein